MNPKHDPTKRGLAGAFLDVVHPPSPVDEEEDEDVLTLRVVCDAFVPETPSTWLQAITFLGDLDALDRQYARGELNEAAYGRVSERLHASVSMETWLAAAHLTRLANRIISPHPSRQTTG